jgi:alpha-ribazole phosphatase
MFGSRTEGERSVVIYLARHAETLWNVEKRFQGHQDAPLTERGLAQARRLGEHLAQFPLAAVYSSDAGRAMSTAGEVAERQGLNVQTHPGLREIDTGAWTGMYRGDVKERPDWAEELQRYRRTPAEHRMPDGESVRQVQARALAALAEIVPRHAGQAIAVISHHTTVETILVDALGLPLESLWLPHWSGNCYLSVLELRGERLQPTVVYESAHLGEELAGKRRVTRDEKATA